jgi:ribulose 1,5-bisphosphate carboxylase large subunit-like protein
MGLGTDTEAIQKPVGVCEVRVMENVEKFHAELGRKPFAKLPALGDRQIPVTDGGVAEVLQMPQLSENLGSSFS